MNKNDLIKAVADTTGHSKKTVTEIVENAFDLIQDAVSDNRKVHVNGFGVFELVHKAARSARNPGTGAAVQVAEKWVPKFKPSSAFGKTATTKQGGAE